MSDIPVITKEFIKALPINSWEEFEPRSPRVRAIKLETSFKIKENDEEHLIAPRGYIIIDSYGSITAMNTGQFENRYEILPKEVEIPPE